MNSLHTEMLRRHLVELLRGGHAHADLDSALARIPAKLRGVKPEGCPYSIWQLLEHIRLGQWDILEFSVNKKHISPKWPEGYWPNTAAPPNNAAWSKSVRQTRADLDAVIKLVTSKRTDLFRPIPHGDGQTILREALLVADHNAYHIGQIVLVRKLLGAWKG